MSLKWKEISRLVDEAGPILVGSVLQKVQQPRELAAGESFVLHGFGAAGAWRIWINLVQEQACWVLAEESWDFDSFPEPSTLVMLLRKRLLGKRISALEQVKRERILVMHFDEGLSLICELLPKRANLLLGDAWNRDDRSFRCIQSFRQASLESGGIYRLPPLPPASEAGEIERDFGAPRGLPLAYHHAVAAHYWGLVHQKGFLALKRLWRQAWKSHCRKVNTALENAKRDFAEARQAELFHKRGMALVANLYALGAQAHPSGKILELDGLAIPLDPAKSYSENAESYFKKSKKFTRASQELGGRVAELEERVIALAAVAEAIEKAESEEALSELSERFEDEGLAVPVAATGEEEPREPEAKLFLEVTSTDGFQILCGRNQEENRRVTFRESKGNDVWLHVKGIPGAHVVVKEQRNKTVPLSTLLEAAQLCLYHSRIRKGKRAEVDYTKRKHVRAIKGTQADVTYTENKTLYVEADPEALKKLMRA